jgi:hypothetical protein
MSEAANNLLLNRGAQGEIMAATSINIWNTSYTPPVCVAPTLTADQYAKFGAGLAGPCVNQIVDGWVASAVAMVNQTRLTRVRSYAGGLNADGTPFWGTFPWWASGYRTGMTPDGLSVLPGETLANMPQPPVDCDLDLTGAEPACVDLTTPVCPALAVPPPPPPPVAPNTTGTSTLFGGNVSPDSDSTMLTAISAMLTRIIAQLKTP